MLSETAATGRPPLDATAASIWSRSVSNEPPARVHSVGGSLRAGEGLASGLGRAAVEGCRGRQCSTQRS